jgi:hypothetical protein
MDPSAAEIEQRGARHRLRRSRREQEKQCTCQTNAMEDLSAVRSDAAAEGLLRHIPLARRPGQLAATDDVQVQMIDAAQHTGKQNKRGTCDRCLRDNGVEKEQCRLQTGASRQHLLSCCFVTFGIPVFHH